MRYELTFSDIPTSSAADTFKTIAALVAADTQGHRCRLRRLVIGSADDAPQSNITAVRLVRINDRSAGTAGTAASSVTAADMSRPDSSQRDGVITGSRNYSVEPTAYQGEPLFESGYHQHGGLVMEWDGDEAPRIDRDQLLGLRIAQRAGTAVRVSGSLEFEEF